MISSKNIHICPAFQVAELIASDTITVPSEEKVYESVLAWVRHDLPRRRAHLPALMESVRLPLLSREYLFQVNTQYGPFGTQAVKDDIKFLGHCCASLNQS